ncbi:MAG TPA: YdcF family protein [Chroococcidiopsis sp.]
MFELLTQILILVGVFFLLRWILLSLIPKTYLTWLGGIILVLVLLWALLEPTNRTIGIVWSLLSFPLRPVGLTLVLLASALRGGIKKADGPLVAWAFAVLLFFSFPLTAYFLTAQTEQRSVETAIQQRIDSGEDVGSAEAIVVLGDGTLPTDPSYRIRTQISNTTDGFGSNLLSRLYYTARVYQDELDAGNDPVLIVSAGPQPEVTRADVSAAQGVTELLVGLGVPQEKILIESEGVDARTSAIAVQKILSGREGTGDVILVAPATSIRRATSTFENLGLKVIPRATDFYVFQLQRGGRLAVLTDLIPSAEALVITTRVVDEYLTTIYYFMRGWLVDPLGL